MAQHTTAPPRFALWRNPVEYMGPASALAFALFVIAVSLAVSQSGIRFDGALDVHRVIASPPWRVAIFDQLNAVILTAVVFWLASLIAARQGRPQDFIVAVAAGRFPNALLAIWSVVALPHPRDLVRMASAGRVSFLTLAAAVLTLPLLIWCGVWLYRGFAASSGMKGGKAGLSFVCALVIAELGSKLALSLISGGD